MKRPIVLVLWLSMAAAVMMGAVKGDSPPRASYGNVVVNAYDASTVMFDGGTGSLVGIPCVPGQNTLAIYNNGILDGGTSRNIYCGFDRAVTPSNGMVVAPNTLFSIDITSALSTCEKQLICTGTVTTMSGMDVRWMSVK